MGPNGALRGQMGPKEEEIMFRNQGPQTKVGRAMGILLISRFRSGSTKNSLLWLVLVRGCLFLYHLKAYFYAFHLSHDIKILGARFMA